MSSNYYYYYAQNSANYPTDPNQQWSNWTAGQAYQQNYSRPVNPPLPPSHHTPQSNYINDPNSLRRPYHTSNVSSTSNGRYFQQQHQQRRYSTSNSVHNWLSKNPNRKRARFDINDANDLQTKVSKKKKKPLSQNTPTRNWTVEEAQKALTIEKEYNKMFRNPSLIIKFPDLELNKDIVSSFHPAIENVHFQQPSTARFCFVTIKESANPDEIISALNKQKFGDGYLTAEYKKDREEDQVIGPEDIDPLTLYVGNLAQEVTKENVTQMYPKGRRIDIGYAKKMKYTRYAFVSFKSVADSIEAFKNTHSRQMHSKSLIVRFRRLNGTVGMPGESKPQNPPRSRYDDTSHNTQANENGTNLHASESTLSMNSEMSDTTDTTDTSQVDLSIVKKESIKTEFLTPFLAGSAEQLFAKHRPIKREMKESNSDDEYDGTLLNNIKKEKVYVKTEPLDESCDDYNEDCEDEESDEELCSPAMNFQSYLDSMVSHKNNLSALKKINP